jgi:hypothetical protein
VHAQAQKAPRTPDVIYVPTPQEVVEDMLRLVNVKKGDVLYDLGSGDGRIPITAAKLYGVRAVGIDIDPQRIARRRRTPRRRASRISSSFARRTCSCPTSGSHGRHPCIFCRAEREAEGRACSRN